MTPPAIACDWCIYSDWQVVEKATVLAVFGSLERMSTWEAFLCRVHLDNINPQQKPIFAPGHGLLPTADYETLHCCYADEWVMRTL